MSETKHLTTEQAVDQIADKPSWLMVTLVLGLMLFNTVCAMVAYFPNMGGNVPYSQWRCNPSSTTCTSRIDDFTDFGWTNVPPEKSVFIDNRCSIKLKAIDTAEGKVKLMGWTNDVYLGEIVLRTAEDQITISSNKSCVNNCKSTLNPGFENDFADVECEITFKLDKTILSFNRKDGTESEVELGNVYSLKDATVTVRHVQFTGIGHYQLHCPDPEQYDKDGLCGVGDKGTKELEDGDFYWSTKGRSSFSVDWKLYCGGEFLRTLISSIYFGGALFGTSIGGMLYDVIGRKKGALIGYTLLIVASFTSAASPSVEFFFVCRFLQGVGVFVGYTGMYVLMLEYTASRHRNLVNCAILVFWALGYLLNTFFGYFIKSWNWLTAVAGFLSCLALIPLLFVPESARYLLVNKNDKAAAKKCLEWLKKINRIDFDLDSVTLKDVVDDKEKEPGFLDTMRDFVKYPEMLIQLGIQMWLWMVAGFLYYGFSFSWSALGSNIYLSYLYAAIGEFITYSAMWYPLERLGMKVSLMIFYFVASVSFCLALIPYSLGGMTVEQLSCLFGSMFVSAAFGSIYLYTIQLSPTSHRGKILGYCSFAARIGSFCGPQASLLFAWNKTATLLLFAVLAALGGACIVRLPRTKGIPTPNSAEDVQESRVRRGSVRLRDRPLVYSNKADNVTLT